MNINATAAITSTTPPKIIRNSVNTGEESGYWIGLNVIIGVWDSVGVFAGVVSAGVGIKLIDGDGEMLLEGLIVREGDGVDSVGEGVLGVGVAVGVGWREAVGVGGGVSISSDDEDDDEDAHDEESSKDSSANILYCGPKWSLFNVAPYL